MAVIDTTRETLATARWNPRQRAVGLMAGVILAVLIAWVSFLARGGDRNSARFAASVVLYASSLAFVAYYIAGPLSRLIHSKATRVLGEERFALAYGFVGMTGVYIACILIPDYMTSARVSLPTLAYVIFTALVSAVFLLSAGNKRAHKSVTLRSLQSMSSGYFWLAFAFVDLDRMVGPQRPETNPYGISLLLLVAALMIRFADAFAQRHSAGLAERAG
jgi:hypothetical protein